MLNLERIPDQLGYLVLTEDGAVIESGGELENNERVANVITGLVTLASKIDSVGMSGDEGFKRISVTYDQHSYVICLSNKKIYIVKRRYSPIPNQPDHLIV